MQFVGQWQPEPTLLQSDYSFTPHAFTIEHSMCYYELFSRAETNALHVGALILNTGT